jgi:hypothetical protein
MANLFEKPIAANPMSEFVGLPLDFISKTLEKRQTKYDTAKADIEAQDESLLGLKFLPGDRARHMELQAEQDQKLNKIIDDANGDYSTIQGSLDRYKRDLNREMNYGELGAQNKNYIAAAAKSKKLEDMFMEGKISEQGVAGFRNSMQTHRTLQTEAGGFTPFHGYNPSTEMNPVKTIHDTIDEVVAQDNSAGQAGRSRNRILTAVTNLFQTNPNVNKALQERFTALPQDPKNPVSYSEWRKSIVEGTVDAKEYQDRASEKNSVDRFSDTQLIGVRRPDSSKGISNMVGNSMIWPKKMLGITREADEYIASEDGQRLVKALESNSGTTMPKDPVARAAWMEDLYDQDTTRNIPVSGDISEVRGAVINGQLRDKEAKMMNLNGDSVTVNQVMQGTDAANKIFTSGVVTKGDYRGAIVISTPSGTYLQQNKSPDVLGSRDYQIGQLDDVRDSLTWNKTVDLYGGNGVPAGVYDVKFNPDTGMTDLYQGGERVYAMYTEDGKKKIAPVTKKE